MLTDSQWIEFRSRFPSAAAFMDRCDLDNERKLLEAELSRFAALANHSMPSLAKAASQRHDWIVTRLAELTTNPNF